MSLRLEDVAFAYRDSPILDGLSLAIGAGITVVLGPNGAGKTTLLKLLIGALTPMRGRMTLDGVALRDVGSRDRAGRLAYAAQRPTVSAPITVRQVVALGLYARRMDPRAIDGALEVMGLVGLEDRPFAELSAGQQQLTSIARALAQLGGPEGGPEGDLEGKFLMLDEPLAALDPSASAQLLGLARVLAGRGLGVVAVLHDVPTAAAIADDALCLGGGLGEGGGWRFGRAAEVLTPGSIEALYGVPFAPRRTPIGEALLPTLVRGPREGGKSLD